MRRLSAVCFAVLVPVSGAMAMGPVDVELEAGSWKPTISGNVQYGGTSGIDVNNVLGLDKSTIGFARGRFHVTGMGNVYLGYTPLKQDGTKTINTQVVFGGVTYNVSDTVTTNADLTSYDVAWTASIIDVALAEFELGLNVKFVDGAVNLTNGAGTDTATLSAPVPMAKAVLRVNAPFVSGELEGAGIAYGGNSFVDAAAQVKLSPVPLFYVAAGYRYVDLQLEDGSKHAFVKNKGPFMAVGFDF